MVGAVGIEIASLLHKDLHGNDLVPLPRFQLLLNVVRDGGSPCYALARRTPCMVDLPSKIEKVLSKSGRRDNLFMWGQMYVDKEGKNVGGWLVDSWSENPPPFWKPQMHYYHRGEKKFYSVNLSIGFNAADMSVHQEDTKIDPARAKFIVEQIDKWEADWWKAGVTWDW
jgi:hypothetical protein